MRGRQPEAAPGCRLDANPTRECSRILKLTEDTYGGLDGDNGTNDVTMRIHIVDKAGHRQEIETPASGRLMLALRNIPEGVQAICGGMMACATCHVHISAPWFGRLAPPSKEELAMLDVLMHQTSGSRLSCQIELNEKLDGLQLTLAPDE